jgi:preprotein translocase subunit SecG
MYTFLLVLIILVAILLIAVVLIQPGKGGDMVQGLGSIGGSMSSMFGSRKAADLLTKTTIGLAISLMFLVIVTNKFFVGNTVETVRPITEGVAVPTQTVPAPAPITPVPDAE